MSRFPWLMQSHPRNHMNFFKFPRFLLIVHAIQCSPRRNFDFSLYNNNYYTQNSSNLQNLLVCDSRIIKFNQWIVFSLNMMRNWSISSSHISKRTKPKKKPWLLSCKFNTFITLHHNSYPKMIICLSKFDFQWKVQILWHVLYVSSS